APARAKLERKEKSLLRKYKETWRNEVPAWARYDYPDFARGFPIEFSCTVGDWLKGGDRLVRRFPVHRLFLRGTPAQMKPLAKSQALRRVKVLDLSYCPLGEDGIRPVVESPNVANLSGLLLFRTGTGLGGVRAIAASPHLARLQRLNLDENPIDAKGAEAI